MALKVERVETWAASLKDKPGSLTSKLEALADGGINLEFVIARRAPDRPGTGALFVAPIKGAAGTRAARKAGFAKADSLHSVRIEAPDKLGLCARITRALSDQGINLRGFSAAAIGAKSVAYVAVDTGADAAKVVRVLRGV
jgi:hypothetical protein